MCVGGGREEVRRRHVKNLLLSPGGLGSAPRDSNFSLLSNFKTHFKKVV